MWSCKHCKNFFDFTTTSQKANHTRWCDFNEKRDSWDKNQGTINKFGEFAKFKVTCNCCSNIFEVEEREKLHPQKEKYFCSDKCAKNRKEWWSSNVKSYRAIAFQNWDKKCVLCGFDKIVAVHHFDENNKNNDPKNLVPLCPNHHEMIHHSKWSKEVIAELKVIIEKKWGCSLMGKH